MHAQHSFDYAVFRVVPCLEREEFVNAGLVVRCLALDFLACRIHLDEARLLALCPTADIDMIRTHLEAFPKICSGDASGGPIAKLSRRERFHWLVSPRSTIIQVSPVHTGLCESPAATFEGLFQRLVRM